MENTEEELVTTPKETEEEIETTPYDDIIDLALVSIEDYHLNKLAIDSPNDFNIVLEGFMIRGLANFENCNKDLSQRSDKDRLFKVKLDGIEKSIIADYTVISWLDKEINDVRQITGMMQNQKEAHRYSEANNLNAKVHRRDQLMEQVATKKTTYSLNKVDWLNKWALK
ncbi:MAG: hypothetical protein MSA56_05855 [Clostridium sp.]|nr:hypothetical protein [Clostridium sp.]